MEDSHAQVFANRLRSNLDPPEEQQQEQNLQPVPLLRPEPLEQQAEEPNSGPLSEEEEHGQHGRGFAQRHEGNPQPVPLSPAPEAESLGQLLVEPNPGPLQEEEEGEGDDDSDEDDGECTGLPQQKPWIDKGYVEPAQEVKCEGLAILDAENYSGFKDLDVNMAKLHFQHELPPGYEIIERIGHGAFGCCFLVEKPADSVKIARTRTRSDRDASLSPPQRPPTVTPWEKYPALPFSRSSAPAPISFPGVYKQEPLRRREDASSKQVHQVVLKVVHGMINPRRPVLHYKTCSLYTLMISHKAFPLIIENLKFIIGMLKYLHTKHAEVHGDLNPGNMMYFFKDVTLKMWNRDTHYGTRIDEYFWPHVVQTQVQVTLDFMDHWFTMEDEQHACIIDADIGGKIGEPKIVVNHLHHDPRNSSWQVSDDLIGLMNWVVIKTGHHIHSHATRGIEYDITLESLRNLHAHIIGVYESLDNKFIFNIDYIRTAPKEPFELKLWPGKCYLDELLEGKFLNFAYFKGCYSLGS